MSQAGLSEVGRLARQADPDRFLCALFLPERQREAMFALIAWNAEIAHAREVASQPLIGLIRLQWWREVVEEAVAGRPPRHHEVAGPLARAIAAHGLPAEAFERATRAREAVIEGEAPETLEDLAARARGEAEPLFSLGLALMGERGADEVAGKAGEAFGLVGLLRSTAWLGRQGEVVLPWALLAEAGADRETVLTEAGTAARRAVARVVAGRAGAALTRARAASWGVEKGARVALLPLVLARASLKRLGRYEFDPLVEQAVARGVGERVAVWWSAMRSRV